MQLMLSFAQEAANQTEPSPEVWQTLPSDQRRETLAVLGRLIAKAAAAAAMADAHRIRKEPRDD
jgi:hypothetical protein